jgi:hypothetical protein
MNGYPTKPITKPTCDRIHCRCGLKGEWQDLTWDDVPEEFVGDVSFKQGAQWAAAKLKEKNFT